MGTCKLILFALIIISFSFVLSYNQNAKDESTFACKWALAENCTGTVDSFDKCIVNVAVINKCPANYNSDNEIKSKCENSVDSDLVKNTLLFVPITKRRENLTYWNVYCALCHGENLLTANFTFWNLQTYHRKIINASWSFVSNVDLSVLEKIKVNNKTGQMISTFGGFNRTVVLLRYLPSTLPNRNNERCSMKRDAEMVEIAAEIKNKSSRMFSAPPKDFSCIDDEIVFCSSKKIPKPKTCFYFNKEHSYCSRNEFLVENVDFIYDPVVRGRVIRSNGEILHDYQYSNVNRFDTIFLCDSIAENLLERIINEICKYLNYLSIFLLFIFLVAKANKKNFTSLPKLVLYSYCLILFVVYLSNFFRYFVGDCLILNFYLKMYVLLSHAFWTSIIAYEYWYVTSEAIQMRKLLIDIKTYRIYAFIGWILPGVLLCLVFLSLSEEDKSASCPHIPDYQNGNNLEHLSGLSRWLHASLIVLYYFIFVLLSPVVLLQGYYFVRFARNSRCIEQREALKRETGSGKRSTSEINYLIIFTKVAYLMSFHYTLFFISLPLYLIFPPNYLYSIFKIFFALHGAFIFFCFGLKNIRGKYQNTSNSFRPSSSTRSSKVESIHLETVGI